MTTETASVLFTDIVGSTALLQRLGEDRADDFRRRHDELMATAVDGAGGSVVKNTGDGVMAVFSATADAVSAAIAIQRAVDAAGRTHPDEAFKVRVGISVGDVAHDGDDWFGTPVVEAARLCDAARGDQIFVADLVRALTRGRGDHQFEAIGALALKGLDDEVPACTVRWEPLTPEPSDVEVPFPPMLSPSAGLPYIGRPATLDLLMEGWAKVEAGACAIDLIVGEPGLGKTRTAAEVAARARGAMVLYGRCEEDLGVPYQPFVEALDHHVLHGAQAATLGRFGGDLVRLVPDLHERVDGLPPAITSDDRAEEHRVFEATAAWLAAASHHSGLVLVVDDLHWATKPTLQLLLHVAQALDADPEARVWIVATYRDTDVDRAHPLQASLGDLRRRENVRRIPLEPFSLDEVIAFTEFAAGHELDEDTLDLARRTHTETEGNPFFLGEVLRHYIETGAVRLVDGRWAVSSTQEVNIPEGVRDVIGRRLDRLGDDADRILTTAAVIGRRFDLDVLEALVDDTEDQLVDVLDEVLRTRLVEETGADSFRFAHALTRSTLVEELSATRLRRLHGRITDVLERLRPNDAAMIALHAVEAGPVGGDGSRAIRHCIEAGDQALRASAHADADRWYATALELLEDEPDLVEQSLEARVGHAIVQRNLGAPEYRNALYAVAGDALANGRVSVAVRAALATYRGFSSIVGDIDEEVVALLRSVLAGCDPASSERALIAAQLAAELAFGGDTYDERTTLLQEGLAIADATADPWTGASVRVRGLFAMLMPESAAEYAAESELAVELADQTADPSLRVLARLHRMTGLMGLNRVRDGFVCQEEAMSLAEDVGTLWDRWAASIVGTQRLLWNGELDAADAVNQQMLDQGQALGAEDAVNFWGAIHTPGQFIRGQVGSIPQMAESLAVQFPTSAANWLATAAIFHAECGDPDEARRYLDLCGDPAGWPRVPTLGAAWSNYAGALFWLQDAERAKQLVPLVEPVRNTGSHYIVFYVGPMMLALGVLYSAMGNHDEAIAALEQAHRTTVEVGSVLGPPWAEQYLGAALLRRGGSGDRDRGLEMLDAAASTFEAHGCHARALVIRDRHMGGAPAA